MGIASSRHKGRFGLAALAFTAGIGVTSLAGGVAGAAASGSPITLVMITSLTGEGASEFSNAPAGFNARIALQNAQGGIDGHKINGVVLDDQTSPTEIATAEAIPVGTAKSRIRLGLSKVRELLGGEEV